MAPDEPTATDPGKAKEPAHRDTETEQKFAKAYEDLMQALDQSWNSEEDARHWREANEELHRAWVKYSAPNQSFERAEAYAEYLRRVRDIAGPQKIQARIDQAFKRYLKTVDDLWDKLGADVHPQTLSLIGQSIAWAGHYAGFRPS